MRATERFHWLDLLRFLAAATVVAVHTRDITLVDYGSLPVGQKNVLTAVFFALTRVGNEAVVLFFVLSGFLVGGKILERTSNRSFRVSDYAIDRTTRIMVPLIPALAITWAAASLIGQPASLPQLLGNLLSLQGILVGVYGGNGPLWSLSYEVWFYVLGGAAAAYLLKKDHLVVAIIILVTACTVFTKLSATYLFCWVIGALAFVRRPKRTATSFILLGTLISVCGVTLSQLSSESVSLHLTNVQTFIPSHDVCRIILSVGFAILLRQLSVFAPRHKSFLKLDAIETRLGDFSYTIYLTHVPILMIAAHYFDIKSPAVSVGAIATLLMLIAICLAFSYGVYWVFERNTGAIRRAIKEHLPSAYRATA